MEESHSDKVEGLINSDSHEHFHLPLSSHQYYEKERSLEHLAYHSSDPFMISDMDFVFESNTTERSKEDIRTFSSISGRTEKCPAYQTLFQQVHVEKMNPLELFNLFTEEDKHRELSGKFDIIGKEINSAFSLFDGEITGITRALNKGKKIMRDWRLRDWSEGYHSQLVLIFRKQQNGSRATLTLNNVPSSHLERTIHVWKSLYWDRLGASENYNTRENRKCLGQKRTRISNNGSISSSCMLRPDAILSDSGPGVVEESASGTIRVGRPIVHIEIPCKNMERVKKFYGDTFDWTFAYWTDYYSVFNTVNSSVITGGFWLHADEEDEIPRERYTTFYIDVEDIDSTLKQAEVHGGEVVQGKTFINSLVGYYAFIRDSEGNQVGLRCLR